MKRVSATKSEGMQTYGNFGKRLDYGGNGREWRGMVRTTQEMIGILRNICTMMGSSPQRLDFCFLLSSTPTILLTERYVTRMQACWDGFRRMALGRFPKVR